ncbi:hypothetical protein AAGG52_14775 [Bacillus licheniformis]
MAARIRKELKAEIPLGQIFKTPTIKGLGEYIRSTKDSVYSSIKKVEEKEYYRLSSAQKDCTFSIKSKGADCPTTSLLP